MDLTEPPDEQASEQRDVLMSRNLETIQRINRMGAGVDPLQVLKLRLDYITACLGLDENDEFACGWEELMGEYLAEVEAQVQRAKLLAK